MWTGFFRSDICGGHVIDSSPTDCVLFLWSSRAASRAYVTVLWPLLCSFDFTVGHYFSGPTLTSITVIMKQFREKRTVQYKIPEFLRIRVLPPPQWNIILQQNDRKSLFRLFGFPQYSLSCELIRYRWLSKHNIPETIIATFHDPNMIHATFINFINRYRTARHISGSWIS